MSKFNPQLLKEELTRFRLINEYSFYAGKDSGPEYMEEEDEETEVNKDVDVDVDADVSGIEDDLGLSDDPNAEAQPPAPTPAPAPVAEPAPAPVQEPADDSIELDVTDLVKGSEAVKMTADETNRNTEILLHKFNDLEARVSNMSVLSQKINDLEDEFIKRNPTPVEKLEMRSLDSFPYTQKLSDYWRDQEGFYDVGEDIKQEYVLTKNDVNSYNDSTIKKSFDYEEEDI